MPHSNGNPFRTKREYTQGTERVTVGFRRSKVNVRIHAADGGVFSFTVDEAEDLADILVDALEDLEKNPLDVMDIHPGDRPADQSVGSIAADLLP